MKDRTEALNMKREALRLWSIWQFDMIEDKIKAVLIKADAADDFTYHSID